MNEWAYLVATDLKRGAQAFWSTIINFALDLFIFWFSKIKLMP
jgi:hypothetical protein